MSSKFEQLLDYLVNEEHERANELFHEIVVEKSREIYENLIATESAEEDEGDYRFRKNRDDKATGEDDYDRRERERQERAWDEQDESVESMFGEEEDDDDQFPVQDETDDLEGDVTDHDFGYEDDADGYEDDADSSAPATTGDIQDLEAALDELKAEFEALMADEKNEPEHNDGEDDPDFSGYGDEDDEGEEPEFGSDDEDEDEEKMSESRMPKTQGERMREYIEKVSVSMVDGEGVGSGRGDKAGQTGHDSGKSPISSGSGKPTSGANARNIAQANKGEDQDGTSPKGKVGGLVKQGGNFVPAGTKNVGANANTKKPDGAKLTNVGKPSTGEGQPVGAGKGDKAGQTGSVDAKSPLNGAPNRAR